MEQHKAHYISLSKYLKSMRLNLLTLPITSYQSWSKVRRIPPEIGDVEHLHSINIAGHRYLQDLGEGIVNLKKLTKLYITNTPELKITATIGELTNLNYLIIENVNTRDLPKDWSFLSKLTKLRELRLSFNNHVDKDSNLLEVIGKLRNLEGLYLNACNIHEVDTFLNPLKKLVRLDLSENPIKTIAKDLSLPELYWLDLSCANLYQASAIMKWFPKLYHLQLHPNILLRERKQLYTIRMDKLVIDLGSKVNLKDYPKAQIHLNTINQVRNAELIEEDAEILWKILAKVTVDLTQVSVAELLVILNSSMHNYHIYVLDELSKRYEELLKKDPINQKSQILLAGKLKEKRRLGQKLKDYGAKIRRKLTDEVTHIVLGAKSRLTYSNCKDKVLVTERLLVNYFNTLDKPYLIESSVQEQKGMLKQIEALLWNRDKDNINLGFELIRGGGFVDGLLTTMFLIYKDRKSFDEKFRQEALRYIRQYAKVDLINLIQKRYRLIAYDGYLKEKTIRTNLGVYEEYPEIDIQKIIRYNQTRYGRGWSYVLLNRSEKEIIEYVETYLLKKGTLDLKKGDLEVFPSVLLHFKNQVQTLILTHNPLCRRPIPLLNQFTILEELYIQPYYGEYGNFPMHLLEIKSLKKIYVNRYNRNIPSREQQREAGVQIIRK
ncbi:MAG: hypothetical protein MK212_01005 [Saprospiraceae bacterium]|nr:hypothetical protein [Saprospiraceae bacterium]